MRDQPHQNSAERITWCILLVVTALFSYKLGGRSTLIESQLDKPQAQAGHQQNRTLLTKPTDPMSNFSSHSTEQEVQESQLKISRQTPKCPPLVCPPCDCKPKPKVKPKRKGRKPPSVKARSPVDQQKLLAWVKRYSPRLKRCRDAGQAIYKLHAQVKLNAKKNKVLSAKVTGRDVPLSARRCVEYDLQRWPAPQQLSPSHPALLIFGLQLD